MRKLLTTIIIILAIPTSLAMLSRLDVDSLHPTLTKAALFLKVNTAFDSVVAYPLKNRTYMFVIALSERRTMYNEDLFVDSLLGEKIPQVLARDNQTLYRYRKGPWLQLKTERLEELKSIVRRNQVRYIVEDVNQVTRLPEEYLKTVYKNRVITIREVVGI